MERTNSKGMEISLIKFGDCIPFVISMDGMSKLLKHEIQIRIFFICIVFNPCQFMFMMMFTS